ncbi:hypothetical protein C2G38_2188699 [Gigaspora rosea]|uniref:SWIM-type domain-containing protein n=1 Tax=Gigaspora rosea TaxID=44941 RepID=A0A397V399_9GLOM|nr:hypothetical protein C2G38_2188699 [Gigaspora rosea]
MLFPLVNSEIGICSYPVGMSGAPCKHQGAVSAKFHISMFNFVPSLKPDDRTVYVYIALGYSAQDKSFYASLHAKPILQNQEVLYINDKAKMSNNLLETKEPEELDKENKKIEEIDSSNFNSFLEEVRLDYQLADQPLRSALDKFKDRYNAAKSRSISRLSSFLYDLNSNLDPTARIKSGPQIRV